MVIDVATRPYRVCLPLWRGAFALCFVGAACGHAFGQRGLPPAAKPVANHLQTVDEGVADRGSNTVSLRRIELDLRQDTGFDHLYEAPGRPDLFMRRDGAITAVFPQSFYAVSKGGMMPVIPPGTIFFIGDPQVNDPAFPAPIGFTERPPQPTPAPAARQNSTPLSLPIDARVSSTTYGPTRYGAAPDDPTALIYMNTERARVQRLREIAERLGPR